jgi:hypothetical protein
MKIDFPYPGYEDIESVLEPDANVLGVYAPQTATEVNDEEVFWFPLV